MRAFIAITLLFSIVAFTIFVWWNNVANQRVVRILSLPSPTTMQTNQDRLTHITQHKKLVVVTRYAPSIYYTDAEGAAGFEYDLIDAFAKNLNVDLVLRVKHSTSAVLHAIANGEGDIAFAGLEHTQNLQKQFLTSTPYLQVAEQVVCYAQGDLPRKLVDLPQFKILVGSDTAHETRLRVLRQRYPRLSWRVTSDLSREQILEQVSLGKIDCTLAHAHVVQLQQQYAPHLITALTLTEQSDLVAIVHPQGHALQILFSTWLSEQIAQGKLAILEARYFEVEPQTLQQHHDIRMFQHRMRQRLPKYRSYFEQAAQQHDLPWTLLAAQAYQESHWNPSARSPTGVRGIMMLTQPTAESLGVDNRLDPQQSIMGGAQYLARLLKRLPTSIPKSERLAFALAAYNVGINHVLDARILARRLGKQTNTWSDMKEVLPLLADKRYYQQLPYGYARGWEPVQFVENVYHYWRLLEQQYYPQQAVLVATD